MIETFVLSFTLDVKWFTKSGTYEIDVIFDRGCNFHRYSVENDTSRGEVFATAFAGSDYRLPVNGSKRGAYRVKECAGEPVRTGAFTLISSAAPQRRLSALLSPG